MPERTGPQGTGPAPHGALRPVTALPPRAGRPGSDGEHVLQRQLGSEERADRFYQDQVLDHLNDRMREFVGRQEMFFLATSDRHGECDNSFRAGPAGFLRVLDPKSLVYPEYRGNGVHASLGNISENPHAGLLLIDFERARIGLHINGRARIVPDHELRALHPDLPTDTAPGRRTDLWVRIDVEEAYIHCAKHIPRLVTPPKDTERAWGTDDYRRKGGDFFGAARDAQVRRAQELGGRPVPHALPPGPSAPPAAPPPPPPDAWRAEARRALERAERAGGRAPDADWFGR
ncbi:pyridoxamine 5'-phosphate oxidase family protein [Streptomyces sp. NPDC127098]|uniref:pyridoxamine 5'-phosphate oxidase family protein n=1 Tax=Streptomyces sp. NPDC127098 TaxID=3347137 RepID=UPI003647BBE9